MRKLYTKWFMKWARKVRLGRKDLLEAIKNLEKGLSTVKLSSNLFKIRVKQRGQGKSGAFRTIIAFKEGDKAIFLYGFRKNEKSNISTVELESLKKLAKDLLKLDSITINNLIKDKILFDIEVEK